MTPPDDATGPRSPQSFTFEAPGFYEKRGYREIFRWDGVPTPDAADVHFRKEL